MDNKFDSLSRMRSLSPGRVISFVLVAAVAIVLLITLFGIKSVQSYEGCLLVRNGKIKEEWGAGLHWRFLPMSHVTCYRTSRTTYEASPGERGGGAHYNDAPVEARSKDGQRIDAVSFRIAFHVPLVMTDAQGNVTDENNLHTVYTTVGARSEDALVASVVAFYARPEVRMVMQLHTGEELLQGDLGAISQEIAERLRPMYAAYGIVLEDVLLSKPDFNDEFEAKLQQEQQAVVEIEIEKQKALQAEQQGQARINAANADATVAAVQAQAEGDRSVTMASANASVIAINSEAEANRTVEQANADATAVAAQIEAYGSTDAYLQAQQIEAMSGWPVQILGEGNALPIVSVVAPTATPSE